MGNPKVSVIVPVYKTEPYLRACLDSVLAQTYRNLQIILVNNGSPDNCGAICDEYAEKDVRVQVIHKANGGPSSSRNAGLAAASGEFISFVDSDDVISPSFIESLLSADADIAQCGYTSDISQLEKGMKVKFESIDGFEMSERLCTEGSLVNTVVWSKLWRRDCFDGIRFPESRTYEDEFVTWKIFWRTNNIARTDAPLYYYRRREGSLMNSGASVHSIDGVDALREKFIFYEACGAIRLADFTKAAFCYTLRRVWKDVVYILPERTDSLEKELKEVYIDVVMSKELGVRKKATVTLQLLSPRLFSSLRSISRKMLRDNFSGGGNAGGRCHCTDL